MSMNPLNDISDVYVREVFKPQLGKGGEKPSAAGAKKVEKGKDDPESSAKRVRQAVYDIRYRARREDVKLDQAYNQYMGHTTMTGPEKNAVKEKLGLGAGSSSSVSEEIEVKKYQVRVKDKSTGKSYVRMATREKINQLRANPNISSVEMTQYGTPYEGERKKGKQTASVTSGKGLDPVGREDKDIDNDGDHDKTDKYLLNRRKVRGKAIATRKEEFSDWRSDLREVINEVQKEGNDGKIKEKSVKNKVVINPEVKIEMNQIADKFGGHLVETVELDEKTLTSAESKKKEEIVKSMKKSFDGFKKRYGERAKDVMYATATARAKDVAEQSSQLTGSAATANKIKQLKVQQSLLQKQQQLEKQKEALAKTNEEYVDEASYSAKAARAGEDIGKPGKAFAKIAKEAGKRYGSKERGEKVAGAVLAKLRKEEIENIDELNRLEREQGKQSGGSSDPAYRMVKKSIRGMEGKPAGQRKKVPGKKPPAAGEYGGPRSPAQKVAMRRAAAQRAQDMMHSPRD